GRVTGDAGGDEVDVVEAPGGELLGLGQLGRAMRGEVGPKLSQRRGDAGALVAAVLPRVSDGVVGGHRPRMVTPRSAEVPAARARRVLRVDAPPRSRNDPPVAGQGTCRSGAAACIAVDQALAFVDGALVPADRTGVEHRIDAC